jgi:H+/Cl- antiporter ClcA
MASPKTSPVEGDSVADPSSLAPVAICATAIALGVGAISVVSFWSVVMTEHDWELAWTWPVFIVLGMTAGTLSLMALAQLWRSRSTKQYVNWRTLALLIGVGLGTLVTVWAWQGLTD